MSDLTDLAAALRDVDTGKVSTHSTECWRYHNDCLRLVAARVVEDHQRLLDAIGDPLRLADWAMVLGDRFPDSTLPAELARIADAIEETP